MLSFFSIGTRVGLIFFLSAAVLSIGIQTGPRIGAQ
jgi:hypothetical protein